MTATERPHLMQQLYEWRRTIPEISDAVQGMLVREGATRLSDLSDEAFEVLWDGCQAMADVAEDGFLR